MLERTSHDPKVRVAAASAVAAGSALAAAKVVRDHAEERRRKKTVSYRLDPDEDLRQGLRRVADGQLGLTLELLDEDDDGEARAKAVHESRKALKRLRALLRISRGALGVERYRAENSTFRDAGRALSGTRDSEVLLRTLQDLKDRYGEALREETWKQLHDSLAKAADQAASCSPVQSASVLGPLSEARERVADWPLPENGNARSLSGGFARVYRRGRRAYKGARSEPSVETLHELRKRAKDLWHSAQLLEAVSPEEMEELQRAAHRLSDLLGEDHDLAILREHARHHSELLEPAELELLSAVTEHRQQELRGEALTRAGDIYGPKPKQLLDRLSLV